MTTSTVSSEISVEDRQATGELARERTPLSSQADWEPAAGRPDPVELLIEQNATREADLVPVRHGRMTVSPFTFYRGAAKVMASDLATTPMAGLVVQLCGDAHLSNFGGFASPERELLFGLNDFDETLPGPFEYDLKRMAASFTIAARNNGFTPADARAVTVESVKAYRLGMAEFAAMRTLDIWYAHMTEHDIQDAMRAVEEASVAGAKPRKGKTGKKKAWRLQGRQRRGRPGGESVKRTNKTLRKAHTRDSLERVDQVRRSRRRPPSHRQPTTRHHPAARPGGQLRDDTRAGPERGRGAVPRLQGHPQRQPPTTPGQIHHRRHGTQGGRRRQRRHPSVHGAAARPRQRRPPVPPGQGGHQLGPRGPPAQEPLQHPRPARGGRSAVDAGRLRHLPRLDQRSAKPTGTTTGASYAT